MEILNALFSLGANIVSFGFQLILGIIAGLIATSKSRSGLFWGVLTFFFPWLIIIVLMLPRKLQRFKSYLSAAEGFKDKNPAIASIMALTAIVAKADGHVSQDEVDTIRRFVLQNFNISSSELTTYNVAFEYGKNHPDEYKEFARIIRLFHNQRTFILSLSYLLLKLGTKQKANTHKEDGIVKEIILELGLTEYEYQSIYLYFTASGSEQSYGGFGGGFYQGNFGGFNYNGQSSGNRTSGNYGTSFNKEAQLDKYRKVLGVSKETGMNEVKKAYRTLAKEYHPDKVESEGMPAEYMKYATERISEINEAYEYVKSCENVG